MLPKYLCIQTSVLAVIRGKLSPRFVAERLGVTEEQVLRWRDTFLAAGTLALDDMLRGYQVRKLAYKSTCIPDDPTTTTTTTESPTDSPSFEPAFARKRPGHVIQTTEDAYATTQDPMESAGSRGGRGRSSQKPRSGR